MKLLSFYKDPQDNWERFDTLAKHGIKMDIPMHMHKEMLIFMNNLKQNNHDYGTTTATVQKYHCPFWMHFACTV
jgi:hypothetical protein